MGLDKFDLEAMGEGRALSDQHSVSVARTHKGKRYSYRSLYHEEIRSDKGWASLVRKARDEEL